MLIFGTDKWIELYKKDRSSIWISIETSSDTIYFKQSEQGTLSTWKDVRNHCIENGLYPTSLTLQFKSHKVVTDLMGTEGVYLAKSAIGRLGESISRDCICVGVLKEEIVKKSIYMCPELIVELETSDHVEDCIEEALLINGEKQIK